MTSGLHWGDNLLTRAVEFHGRIDRDSLDSILLHLDYAAEASIESCFAEGASIGDRLRGFALIFDLLDAHWKRVPN